MELFLVNRHIENTEQLTSKNVQEQKNLLQTLKKIEVNKKLRNRQKENNRKLDNVMQTTSHIGQLKRKRKETENDNDNDSVTKNDEFFNNKVENESQIDQSDLTHPSQSSASSDIVNEVNGKTDVSDLDGFTILGGDSFNKKSKVKRILPRWLRDPTIIAVNLQKLETKVSDINGLDKQLRKLLKSHGVQYLFPVQAIVIPWLIESNRFSDILFPRDICVSAPTGSGKTLAFVLPVIEILKKYTVKKIRALVVLPTQDLARQVFGAFKTFSDGTNVDVCLISGQNRFEVEQKQILSKNQAFGFTTKVDILVCTPGRLVEHLKLTEGLDLQFLQFLIIDEADRVLENIQNDWLYHLGKHVALEGPARVLNQYIFEKPRPPQKLLFSATLSQDPEKLQQLSLYQPKLFTSVTVPAESDSNKSLTSNHVSTDTFIGKYTTPEELTEKYIETSIDLKPLALYKFIEQENLRKTLIFTHSRESAHKLAILLEAMFENRLVIQEISSHLQAKNRTKLIQKFSEGKLDLLICTDALARGIHLPGVECVISYSAPKYLKSYIHRAGRTARAGKRGLAVTFLCSSQLPKFKALLEQAGKHNVAEIKITEESLEPLVGTYRRSLKRLKETIEKEEKVDLRKLKTAKRSQPKLNSNRTSELNGTLSRNK